MLKQHQFIQAGLVTEPIRARSLEALTSQRADPLQFDSVAKASEERELEEYEAILIACNETMEAHGVEPLKPDGQSDPVAYYVNRGDTYDTTIIWIVDQQNFFLMSWGDYLAEWESNHI